jgi:large subunit ribosomal protein L30
VSEKSPKTIRIKWVRSGIGFTKRQKTIVASLGLTKLNHTVVRLDTPQVRGTVAAVPHLLEIVAEPVAAPWASIPEYTIRAAEVAPPKAAPQKSDPPASRAVAASAATEVEEEKPAKPRRKKKAAPAETSKE